MAVAETKQGFRFKTVTFRLWILEDTKVKPKQEVNMNKHPAQSVSKVFQFLDAVF